MSKILNTSGSKRLDWLFGGNPNAIEAQEAEGQKQLVASSQLPRLNSRDQDSRSLLESLGVTVLQASEGDPLFYDVKLPEGWTIKASDHSMWSYLVDDKGENKAAIFYKAAFYDRGAFIRLND